MVEEPRKRQIIRDLEQDARKAQARQANMEAAMSMDIYPLDAPGLAMPGPDFIDQATRLGGTEAVSVQNVKIKDEATGRNKTVKRLHSPSEILHDLHRRALREPGFAMPVTLKPGTRKLVNFVPGHIWGQYAKEYESGDYIPVDGPRPADVMIIGKMPGKQEAQDGRCLVGESGRLLIEVLRQYHVKGTSKWYVTNLLKFRPPDGSTTIKASWEKDCMPLLQQELRLVRPKYILCLGSDASKSLLGKKFSQSYMDGRVVEYEFPVNTESPDSADKVVMHKALVMTVVHPAAVAREPTLRRTMERGIARFDMLAKGIRWDKEEKDVDHRQINTLEELQALFYEIDHDPMKKDRWIAMDAEWHGEHPVNKGSYVRTIQLAWRTKHAASVIWHNDQGQPCFVDANGVDARDRGVALFNKFLINKRVTGHFFVADLEWLTYIGMHQALKRFKVPLYDKPFDEFSPPQQIRLAKRGFISGDVVPAYLQTMFSGGWDTGIGGHSIEETAQLGLEILLMRYTTCPRYDIPLYEWKEKHCKERGIKAKDLEGYGPCPDNIIVPYGCYDADGTLRLLYEQLKLIDNDYNGNNCREPFWEGMITLAPILEIHQEGIPIDRGRIDYLTQVFMAARAAMEQKIQAWARWPDFNIRSVQQVREFLFGTEYNGKVDKEGRNVRLRPPEGRTLALDPILDTSKPPKQWWEIREKGQEREHTPGTGKTILGVLAHDNPDQFEQVQWLRDYRFLDQVLKSVLRPPKTDKDGNIVYEETEDLGADTGADTGPVSTVAEAVGAISAARFSDNLSGLIYEAGLASVVCDDGKVRTHLYPTTETGRWRSARPNLQNMSKRRDDDYERMLGKDVYKWKLRSILCSEPGTVLIEADFKSAELYCMAIMSGDSKLLEHCTRNQLAEDHPDFYDIHSNIAVTAFGLHCPPTKKGLKSIGKVSLRVAAKNVIFGIAYGRGAKAIALQCKEEGNAVTVEQAQQIINTVLEMYPGLVPFFEEAKRRTRNPGWMSNCFGRLRRFPHTDDQMLASEFERQGMNFPIQSMVASAMDRAIAYLQDYRDNVLKDPGCFRIKLQIHDALMVQAPYRTAAFVASHVLPHNMTDRVAIWPSDLSGVPTGVGPFHLGTDVEMFDHWGEPLKEEFCQRVGIPLEYAH